MMELPNIPRDVATIITKYIHRYNYMRCIEEYNRIYIPHFSNNYTFFLCDTLYSGDSECPIIKNKRCCPVAMYRKCNLTLQTEESRGPVYKIIPMQHNCIKICNLPLNY